MPKLTDTQSVLLVAAAARPDLAVLPPPEALKAKGAALERTLEALRRRGLIAEAAGDKRKKIGATAEAGDGNSRRGRLIITGAGLEAIGVQESRTQDCDTAAESAPQEVGTVNPQAIRPAGKMGTLLDTVCRPGGASIKELTDATGWLPHTTRAALTRLRQRGYDVQLGTCRRAQGLSPEQHSLIDAVGAA